MCITTTKTKSLVRSARWVYGRDSARPIEDGIATPLILAIGENSWCYLVERHGSGWKLTHVKQDDSGAEEYALTRNFCECNDAKYRRRPEGCKHVAGLRAALAWLGIEM